jgi:hypothetical protein
MESAKNQKYDSIQALIRNVHGGSSQDLIRRHSNENISVKDLPRTNSDRTFNALQMYDVEKLPRKRSMFEGSMLKIPKLTISGPRSADSSSSPNEEHRRFSFGHFRRHSHTAVS